MQRFQYIIRGKRSGGKLTIRKLRRLATPEIDQKDHAPECSTNFDGVPNLAAALASCRLLHA